MPLVDGVPDLCFRSHLAQHVEILGGGHGLHEIPALLAAAFIQNDGGQVFHVVVEKAVDGDLNERDEEEHHQGQAVAAQLQKLFPYEGPDAVPHITAPCATVERDQ